MRDAQAGAAVLVVDADTRERSDARAVGRPDRGRRIAGGRLVSPSRTSGFAVIVMDTRRESLDGYETAKRIREETGTELTPIIFLTAFGDDELETAAAYGSGAVDFVFTPVLSAVLRAKVSTFMKLVMRSQQLEDSVESIMELNSALVDYLRHGGQVIEGSVAVSAIRDDHQEVIQLFTQIEDVTDARRTTRELEQAQFEMHDDDTGRHTHPVGERSVDIAARLGLPDSVLELVPPAAVLHDVGKIAIPDAVLSKRGKLTAKEFDLVNHEKWDGSGYPAGLSGDAIPITGRIVAVAGVFDALTHVRPYKPAWADADAEAEVRSQAGRHFDPQVVDAFFSARREPRSALAGALL